MANENAKKEELKETLDDRELNPEELDKAAGGGIGPGFGPKIHVKPKYPQPGQEEDRADE